MLSIDELRIGETYDGKSALRRKIISFWIVKMGREKKRSKSASVKGAVVEYVWVNDEGSEVSKPIQCEPTTFVKWTHKDIDQGSP